MTRENAGCARTVQTLDKRQQWPSLIFFPNELQVLELLVESCWLWRQIEASTVEPPQEIVSRLTPIPSRSADDTICYTDSPIDKSGSMRIGHDNSFQR
jgi:hypothetical protein